MKLGELVQILNGKLAQGNPEFVVTGVNSSALASSTEIVFAEDAPSAAKALASSAGVVLLRSGLAEAYPEGKCVVEAEQPRLWFAWAGKLLTPVPPATGVHPAAVVGANVKLGAGVSIGPCAVSARVPASARGRASRRERSSARACASATIAASILAPFSIPEPRCAIA